MLIQDPSSPDTFHSKKYKEKPKEEEITTERYYQAKKPSNEEIINKIERLSKKIKFKKKTYENLKREFDYFNCALLQNKFDNFLISWQFFLIKEQ